MAEPEKRDLADLVAPGLTTVGGIDFPAPSSAKSVKPKTATATFLREVGPGLKTPLKQPLSLACLPDGAVLVLDKPEADRFRLLRCDADGASAQVLCTIAKGNADAELMEPVSLLVDGEQQLYLVDAREACVKKYSAVGRWLDTYRSAGPTGKLFNYPLDAAIDEAGNLLIADTNNNRIVQLQADGELGWILEKFPLKAGDAEMEEFYEPCSVCIGRGGIVRIADRNENRVLGFDAQRKLIGLWPDLSFPSLVRMAADGTSVLVAERSRILRHAASGTVTAVIEFPLDIGGDARASGGGAMTADALGNLLVLDPVRESILVFRFDGE